MRFLFTADWQADWDNLDLCEQAANEVLTLLDRYNLEGVVVAGDLKRHYNPVDFRVTNFWVRFIERAAARQKTVIVVRGNHDRAGMYDDAVTWFPALHAAGAITVDTARVIKVNDGTISCLPFKNSAKAMRKSAAWLKKQQGWEGLKGRVLVFHADVKEAKYNVLGQRSDSKLTVQDLHPASYDICLGGHIHMRQMLGENVFYLGSPFVTDWGEANQIKSYTIIEDKRVKIIPSRIPGWYDPTWPHFPPAGLRWEDTRIRIHVKCPTTQNYGALLDKARADAEHKYPGAQIYAVPEFQEDSASAVKELTGTDEKKIEAYVGNTLPAGLDKQRARVLAYLKHRIRVASAGMFVRETGRIHFTWALAKNFLSYERLLVGLNKPGIRLVVGKNLDWPGKSNGSGKTNLLQPLAVALFGSTFKGQKHDAWAKRGVEDMAYVAIGLRDSRNRKVVIRRERHPGALKLKVNDEDQSSGTVHSSQLGTQGLIERTVGYTWQTFANAVYMDQREVGTFLSGTPGDRKKILERFQNLERFNKAGEVIAKDAAKVERAIEAGELSLASYTERRKEYERELRHVAQESLKSKLSEATLGLQHCTKEADRRLAQQRRLLLTLRPTQERQLALRKIVERKTAVWEADLVRLEAKYQRLRSQRRTVKALQGVEACPTCAQPVTAEHLQKLFSSKAEHAVTYFERAIASLKQKKMRLLCKDAALVHKVSKLLAQYNEVYLAANAQASAVVGWRQQLKAIKQLYKSEQKTVARLKKQVALCEQRARQFVVEATELGRQQRMLEYCKQAVSRSGIPAYLNALLCPVLNRAALHYSKVFTDGLIQVRFETQEDGGFDIKILNSQGGEGICDQSVGEGKFAGIITGFALREIAPPCNVLVLDEPGDGLDPANARAFAQGLRKIAPRFGSVFLTTHNPHIISEFAGERTITVVKRKGTSYVQTD